MTYLGDFAEDTTITFEWNTFEASGASVTRGTNGTVYVKALNDNKVGTGATVTKANPGVVTATSHGLSNGDEVLMYGMTEMTELNGTIQVVANQTTNTFEIEDTSSHGTAETTGGSWTQVNTADVTDTEDVAGITGQHSCSIACAADDYYAVATDFVVGLLNAVVDGQTVSSVLRSFSIENRFKESNVTQWNGTAVATPDTAGYPVVTIKDGTGAGEINTLSGAVVTVSSVSTLASNSITSGVIADSAKEEIRDAITGGAYALDTDANGRIRLVSGTGAGEVGVAGGLVTSNVQQWLSTTLATPDTSGYPKVTIKEGSGTGELPAALRLFYTGIVSGTVDDSGFTPTTTAFQTDLTEATDTHFNNEYVFFYSGALKGQARLISEYNGTSKRFTTAAFTEAPGDGDGFIITGRTEP